MQPIRSNKQLVTALLLAAGPLAALTQAGVVLGNLGSGGTGTIGNTGYGVTGSAIGIPFTTGSASADLDSVSVGLLGGLQATQTVSMSLHADNSGEPANSPISGGWSDTENITSASAAVYTFVAGAPYTLLPNTPYWLVMSPQVGFTWIDADPTGSPTAQNASGWSYPAGGAKFADEGSWTAVGQQNSVSISATLVPEPTLLATGVGVALAIALGRRARHRRNAG